LHLQYSGTINKVDPRTRWTFYPGDYLGELSPPHGGGWRPTNRRAGGWTFVEAGAASAPGTLRGVLHSTSLKIFSSREIIKFATKGGLKAICHHIIGLKICRQIAFVSSLLINSCVILLKLRTYCTA
jgi:hypothetical protein